ncbi:hypothetical protein BSLG_006434 [Batrachochytrium salamandrivorans]|nr:hypothetical protein BSLG_006434 [Batrachochytrium salamandrivorans]
MRYTERFSTNGSRLGFQPRSITGILGPSDKSMTMHRLAKRTTPIHSITYTPTMATCAATTPTASYTMNAHFLHAKVSQTLANSDTQQPMVAHTSLPIALPRNLLTAADLEIISLVCTLTSATTALFVGSCNASISNVYSQDFQQQQQKPRHVILEQVCQRVLASTRISIATVYYGLQLVALLTNATPFGSPASPFIYPDVLTAPQIPPEIALTVVALSLADTSLNDTSFPLRFWAAASGVPLSDLIRIRASALVSLDYRLNIGLARFSQWVDFCPMLASSALHMASTLTAGPTPPPPSMSVSVPMSEPTSHTALFCESAMSVLAATPPPSPPGYPLITTATGALMDTIDTTANSGVNSAMALADTIAFSAASPVLRRRHASPFNPSSLQIPSPPPSATDSSFGLCASISWLTFDSCACAYAFRPSPSVCIGSSSISMLTHTKSWLWTSGLLQSRV